MSGGRRSVVAITLAAAMGLAAASPAAGAEPWVPGELIVSYRDDVRPAVAESRIEAAGGSVVERLRIINGYQVRLRFGRGYAAARTALERLGGVRAVGRNFLYRGLAEEPSLPDDPRFGQQWNLHNTGQEGGVPDADVDAPEAWQRSQGEGQVIAVVDEGVDIDHPDLAPNVWVNEDEIAGNGLDDDANGYVDDVNGWNFVQKTNDPSVGGVHGTWVAGVATARAGNGIGIAGAAPRARMMALKFAGDTDLADFALGTSARAIEAIGYAVDNGADVINNSWGYYAPVTFGDPAIWLAVLEAGRRDVVVAWAGGNNSAAPLWPGFLPAEHVIVATGSSRKDEICPITYLTTGQGEDTPLGTQQPNPLINDVAAPACQLVTTQLGGGYEAVPPGTSFAAPHVAAAAALLRAAHPELTAIEVKCLIKRSVDRPIGLLPFSSSMGRLNARAALELADEPGAPEDCPPDP